MNDRFVVRTQPYRIENQMVFHNFQKAKDFYYQMDKKGKGVQLLYQFITPQGQYEEHLWKDNRNPLEGSFTFDAENFGGDPEGKLAKALERARKKAKQPRKPLKIERLKAEKIDYSSWICPVEEEFDFGEGMEKYECGSTDYRIVKDSASPTGYTVECSSCRSDISYDHEPYLQAKEAYEEKERKRIKQRYSAESPQVDDEGMLGRIRKVRIVGIEDNSGKKDRKGNPIQNVYFYRELLDSGEADWRIHTDSERKFLSRFKPDKKAESFGAESPSYMADSDAHKLMEASWRINSFVESGEEYPEWWKSRLSVAASTVDDLADYLSYAMSDDYEAEENQYEFWSVWENDDDYDSVSDFDTEQEAIDFYEKMIKKHGEDSYLLFGNDGKGGVVELEVVMGAETFNASIKHNPYSVDLYEDEDTPPYYPYLAPEYTNVYGRGRYRFNRYNSDGMTWYQYRFPTKDKAIEWLCYQSHTYVQVKPNQPQYDFPPNTPDSEIKKWHRAESFGAENSSLAKRSWDALNNVETAVGTVGLAHMIGIGAIFGGGLAFLKGRKSNSKTEK